MTSPRQAFSTGDPSSTGGLSDSSYDGTDSGPWRVDGTRSTWGKPFLLYKPEDYRQELERVERKLYWLTIASIIVAVLAIAAIISVVIQTG